MEVEVEVVEIDVGDGGWGDGGKSDGADSGGGGGGGGRDRYGNSVIQEMVYQHGHNGNSKSILLPTKK